MQLMPFAIRATLSSDPDVRRLFWLTRRAKLQAVHRAQLEVIERRVSETYFGEWARTGERELIRVLFNLHRGTKVRIKD